MSPSVSLTTPDKENPESKTLSIEIEPSPSLILDMVHLLKIHHRQSQALELCKVALNYFPQDVGLRLGMAMAYMDLNEKEKGRAEIIKVAQELKNLAPTMEITGRYFRQVGETRLSEWFTLISNTLMKYPEERTDLSNLTPMPEKSTSKDLESLRDSLASPNELPFPSPATKKEEMAMEEKVQVNSQVLSSLNDWLSQLKGGKAREETL